MQVRVIEKEKKNENFEPGRGGEGKGSEKKRRKWQEFYEKKNEIEWGGGFIKKTLSLFYHKTS